MARQVNPKLKVKFKNEAGTHNWIERLAMRLGNWWFRIFQTDTPEGFTTNVTTVLFNSLMFPSQDFVNKNPERAVRILRHEIVHLRDQKKHGWWFHCSYLFLLPVFWTMRANWEGRAYTQTLLHYKQQGLWPPPQEVLNSLHKSFTGTTYVWMATESWYRRWLVRTMSEIESGVIPEASLSYPHPEIDLPELPE